MSGPKKGLGSKGLGMEALFNTQLKELDRETDRVIEIDINKIETNPNQPRKRFKEEALTELAQSISEYGVIQPVIVKREDDYYVLIAGERRFRAGKIAGLRKIPAIVREADESQSFEMALVENIQRENLNPMEEAESYRRLNEEYRLSQEEISGRVGKSRVAVTNSLRLLNLDPRVKNFISENKLSGGHGRALLAVSDKDRQFELAEKIIEEGLSVRTAEALVRVDEEEKPPAKIPSRKAAHVFPYIEEDLQSILGTKVKVLKNKRHGRIEIEYYSDDDLDRLYELLKSIGNRR